MATPSKKRLKQIKQPAQPATPAIATEATLDIDGITIAAGDMIRIDGRKGRFRFEYVEPAEIPAASIVKVFEMQGNAPRMARFFYASQIVAPKVPKRRKTAV